MFQVRDIQNFKSFNLLILYFNFKIAVDVPPVKSVVQEDLLTKITSVPQRQTHMQGNNPQQGFGQGLQQRRPINMRGQVPNKSHMEQVQNPVSSDGMLGNIRVSCNMI